MIRWLRWNLVCRRGRKCANLVDDEYEFEAAHPEEDTSAVTAVLSYACGGCGTVYREEVLLDRNAHAPIPLGRERVR